jgi:hypothetical protein
MGRNLNGRPRRPVHQFGMVRGFRDAPTEPGTGSELLRESAVLLEASAQACDDPADAARFSDLAARVQAYLSTSRSTPALRLPQNAFNAARPGEEGLSPLPHPSHVRVIPS